MVGIAPEECFALATYKIWSALRKQDEEHLPYLFVVVSLPGVTAESVGHRIPSDLAWLAALVKKARRISGVRDVEERVVDTVQAGLVDLTDLRERLDHARWLVISARKADILVRQYLYQRVYALRVRSFAMNYRGAEVDMHLSLREDMVDLDDVGEILRDHGVQGLVARLSDGAI